MPIASHNPTPKAQHRSADTDKEAVLILVSNLRSCLPYSVHRQRTVWLERPVEVLDVYPSHTWVAKVFKLVPLACFVLNLTHCSTARHARLFGKGEDWRKIFWAMLFSFSNEYE